MSNQSTFIHLIKTLTPFPPEQEEAFRTLLSVRPLKKGEYFVRAGQRSRTIAVVADGLFRYYYLTRDGVEYTKGFFDRHTVLSAYDAILENRPSYFTIEALEDSVIEAVDYDQLARLFDRDPCWMAFAMAMIQKGYLAKVRRERELLMLDAEERYRAFLTRYPGLESRVKQHIIASYIGITPESLSRIRRKMGLLT